MNKMCGNSPIQRTGAENLCPSGESKNRSSSWHIPLFVIWQEYIILFRFFLFMHKIMFFSYLINEQTSKRFS